MSKREKNLWAGLNDAARAEFTSRDYKVRSFAQRVTEIGVEACELAALDRPQTGCKKDLDSRRGNIFQTGSSAASSRNFRRVRPAR